MRLKVVLWMCLAPLSLWAQEYQMAQFELDKNPPRVELTETESKSVAVVLKDFRFAEYVFDANNDLVLFETKHKVVRLNEDLAIEEFNKVYIPLYGGAEIVSWGARAIAANGKTQDIDPDQLKDLEEAEGFSNIKMFAIEGLEKGSDVEYFYTVKKPVSYFGRQTFQSDHLVRSAEFTIVSPDHLVFIAKAYNGFPQLELTEADGKRTLSAKAANIPMLENERYAAINANRMRVDYKISHNTQAGSEEIFTWDDAANHFFGLYYPKEEKEIKRIRKALAELNLGEKPVAEKVAIIENYLKTEYTMKADLSGGTDLELIMKEKSSNAEGFYRLFAGYLTAANIEHEIVLTTDRYGTRFDGDFQTWNFLENYLFYFPELDQFLAPDLLEYRLGLFPFEWSNNDGLFVQLPFFNGKETATSEVRHIPAYDVKRQFDNMSMELRFDASMQSAEIMVWRKFGGINAMFIQPYYDLIPPKDQGAVVEDILKFMGEDAEVVSSEVKNHDRNVSPLVKPMLFSGELKVNSIVEKAGKDYLLNVGQLIGGQVEMYQEKPRQNVVDMEYPHQYLREISIYVPEGYELKGLESLNMEIVHEMDGKKELGFTSRYDYKDGKLYIVVSEWYNRTDFGLEDFEPFREVINAAADFNKVVLVLAKKEMADPPK